MYYYIKGKVVYFEDGRLVVENNGIGYDILVSKNTQLALADKKDEVLVYTCVKISSGITSTDETIKIYGFANLEEKGMFVKLTSISGVGPKTALQILSEIDPKTLALNIVNADSKALSKVKGIGKKTAMRIILELKEKLEEEDFDTFGDTPIKKVDDQMSQDAVLALASLGMTKGEAAKKVAEVRANANSVEEIITIVLKGMR
ncbi:MAG: Holliday junction branch migration protein RuvA [Clostridiales bacterium]|nr:Holliday junction branch migration protein RuvA [Clostridiales bacterium]